MDRDVTSATGVATAKVAKPTRGFGAISAQFTIAGGKVDAVSRTCAVYTWIDGVFLLLPIPVPSRGAWVRSFSYPHGVQGGEPRRKGWLVAGIKLRRWDLFLLGDRGRRWGWRGW